MDCNFLLRFLITLLFLPLLCSSCLGQDSDPIAKYREAATKRWDKSISQLEELDKSERDPKNAILYIGSSSIRRWTTVAEDMAPWPAIRRGYGGAKFSDLAVFVDRLVNPHQFDALVIFVGNDISGSEQDKTPEEVLRLFNYVVERVRVGHPKQPIFLIAITPTSSRFHVWPQVQAMHKLVEEYVAKDDSLHFIATAKEFIGADGKPKDELFVKDRLHLNEDGYDLWASIIKKHLEKVLGQP